MELHDRGTDKLLADLARADAVKDRVEISDAALQFEQYAHYARADAYSLSKDPQVAEPIFRAIIGAYGQGFSDGMAAADKIHAKVFGRPATEQPERFDEFTGPCCGGGSQCRCGGGE